MVPKQEQGGDQRRSGTAIRQAIEVINKAIIQALPVHHASWPSERTVRASSLLDLERTASQKNVRIAEMPNPFRFSVEALEGSWLFGLYRITHI